MGDKKAALYLVTGFLGSGKTTIMQKLLSKTRNRKVGVIMNEFGSVGVDGAILEGSAFDLIEVNEGSVFCTCRSDAFIDALWALADKDLDVILVETSGMSDPISIPRIMETVSIKTDRIIYHGCITVASAVNILKLLNTTLFVQGQVRQADVIILNKIDLVGSEDAEECIRAIRQFNTTVPVIKASFCNVTDPERLLDVLPGIKDVSGPMQTKYSSAVSQFTLGFSHGVDRDHLVRLLELFKDDIHRAKGFVSLSDGTTVHVDGVAGDIPLKPIPNKIEDSCIVFIYQNTKPIKHLVKQAYKEIFNESPVMIP